MQFLLKLFGMLSGKQKSALLGSLGGMLSGGGLTSILGKLTQAGLGSQVDSWVGTGTNASVSPKALSGALGADVIGKIAAENGVSNRQAANGLSKLLPQVVNSLSPKGALASGTDLDDLLKKLPSLLG